MKEGVWGRIAYEDVSVGERISPSSLFSIPPPTPISIVGYVENYVKINYMCEWRNE